MRRCDGAMLPSSIASPHRPSHRLIVHRIASSSIASPHRPSHRLIASPHRPSHRLIVHRIASSSIALDIIRNASVSLLGHHTILIRSVDLLQTTFSGSAYQGMTTRCEKKFLRGSRFDLSLYIFEVCPLRRV